MTLATLMQNETVQLINGPAGKLEAAISKPPGKEYPGYGVVCHPHPLFGGTMHNKVVTTLIKVYQALGLGTVRFNFRGVEESQGQFDQGNGEVEDLLAVINWVTNSDETQDIWLAGFSFGAYVAAKAATLITVKNLITVAPPVTHFPMQTLPPITCPWVLVQGELDEVISPQAVFAWADSRDPKPTRLCFPQASHFFHGQLNELRMRLLASLRQDMAMGGLEPPTSAL